MSPPIQFFALSAKYQRSIPSSGSPATMTLHNSRRSIKRRTRLPIRQMTMAAPSETFRSIPALQLRRKSLPMNASRVRRRSAIQNVQKINIIE